MADTTEQLMLMVILQRNMLPEHRKKLDYIAGLVRGAIGYDENRGDLIEVQNLQFDTSIEDENEEYFANMEKKEMINTYITRGIIVLTIIIAFIMIRRLTKSSAEALGLPEAQQPMALAEGQEVAGLLEGGDGEQKALTAKKAEEPEEEIDEDQFIMHLSPEAKARLKAKEKMVETVKDFVKNNPEDASQLFRLWMTKGEAK